MKKSYIILIIIIAIIIINFPSRFKEVFTKCESTDVDFIIIKPTKTPTQTELNHAKLKTYKGFEGITEEESVKHIENIKKMAKILFHLHINEQNN